MARSGQSAETLAFVRDTMDLLVREQSARLGGASEGQLCLTVTRKVHRSYRSLGHLKPDGTHQTCWFPGMPMDLGPTMLDLDLWPVLQRLSALTGDAQYGDLAEGMAAAFARHGFDERCGLGYLGEEAGFDVVRMACLSTKTGSPEPHFKPRNSGTFPGLPLDLLWQHAPAQMHRMFRAMYWGLVTDAASMDFNRFCGYDFSDADERPALERTPGHCAFESCAARMIHWWANCFAQTGDADCLRWAERMTDKWAAVQHPESGLVPNFFGAVAHQPGAPMPPGEWAETRGAALMAAGLMNAVGELRRREGGEALAARLQDMAVRLARGLARFAYDTDRHVFREHLHLDGSAYEATARYVFHTAAEKAEAVRRDPELAQVPVYAGAGFYRPSTYWEYCAGVNTPVHLAEVAAATGEAELAELLAPLAAEVVAASRREPEPLTLEGSWTFRASAYGIKMLVLLGRREQAREIAEAELARLARPADGDWWRMPERSSLLDALLLLEEG
jgi:hypothetical protein